ncbi:MAG: hypothetical protein KH415_23325 [Clostridium sp.]|jgi:uncharacterized membrane protein|uniref:hypothetical protein n=1 Tax=Clostridium tertium TaxID=1559 RepID=UPI003564CE43|nr:hypothetical protein [Clostridium sp.]
MNKLLLVAEFIIFSVFTFLLANLLSNMIAPSSDSMEVLMVCVTILLSLIVGLLGVILQEISNLKNK